MSKEWQAFLVGTIANALTIVAQALSSYAQALQAEMSGAQPPGQYPPAPQNQG